MKISETPLPGVKVIELDRVIDSRGGFMRFFCQQKLSNVLRGRQIVQANHSHTAKLGTVRGLHFQYAPHAEMKLVLCLRGAVWDVIVDLRPSSPTFLTSFGINLTMENSAMVVVPEGCAHGFQAQLPDSELLYLHTSEYAPEAEGGIKYDDPSLAIQWPLPIGEVSDRDRSYSFIDKNFVGVVL